MMLVERDLEPQVRINKWNALRSRYDQALFWITFASGTSIVFSIAVSQILMGAGLLMVLIRPSPHVFPPIKAPLALFFAWTVLSAVLSGHLVDGFPQIKKFFVFAIVVLISRSFRNVVHVTTLFFAWVVLGVLSAADGFAHLLARYHEAIRLNWNSYDFYLDDRIKGFANHWMTFGAEQMIILLLLLAYLLFACPRRWRILGWACAGLLWLSLMLGLTRCIFLLGVPVGAIYLLAVSKPWTLALTPVIATLSWVAAPFQVHERVESVLSPHGDLDSNAQRAVSRRTGWEMVKAHPWFGLGPEQIRPQFLSYVPPDVQHPLPRGWYGHLHNVYLQYAAERGVPALFFFLWLIGRMVADFTKALWSHAVSQRGRWVVHGAIAVIGAILAEGFFEHDFGDSEVLTMFLIVTTGAYVVTRSESRLCS
jgi:O-antigen ligase